MPDRLSSPRPDQSRRPLATGVLLGAAIGLVAAVALAVLPDLISGNGFYENTDPMLVYGLVLVPVGAAAGLLVGAVVSARRSSSPLRLIVASTLLVIALIGSWKVWSTLTGTPGPF